VTVRLFIFVFSFASPRSGGVLGVERIAKSMIAAARIICREPKGLLNNKVYSLSINVNVRRGSVQ
jgi:hypothetical protein